MSWYLEPVKSVKKKRADQPSFHFQDWIGGLCRLLCRCNFRLKFFDFTGWTHDLFAFIYDAIVRSGASGLPFSYGVNGAE